MNVTVCFCTYLVLLLSASSVTAYYWPWPITIGDGFARISAANENRVAFLNDQGVLRIFDLGGPELQPVPAQWYWYSFGVAADGTRLCVLNRGFFGVEIVCTDDYTKAPTWYILPYRDNTPNPSTLTLQGNTICVTYYNWGTSYAMCATVDWKNKKALWVDIASDMTRITVFGRRFCGVSSRNIIRCKLGIAFPTWSTIPGLMKTVDLVGNTLCGVDVGDNIQCLRDISKLVSLKSWVFFDSKGIKWNDLYIGKLWGSEAVRVFGLNKKYQLAWGDLVYTSAIKK